MSNIHFKIKGVYALMCQNTTSMLHLLIVFSISLLFQLYMNEFCLFTKLHLHLLVAYLT
jgi:hypothetical protein